MIPKEFQKSNLALELKAGKKRLEGVLHGLSDEQSERAGVTRSASVVDVLSEIVATEFLALMAISSRLPGLPVNRLANADEGNGAARGTERAAASKSFETLLAEFNMLRSAVIRLVEGRKSHGANSDAKYEYVESFRVTATFEDGEGNFVTDWEAVLGGTYSTGIALRWRTVRAWKNRMVIAERIEELRSPNS